MFDVRDESPSGAEPTVIPDEALLVDRAQLLTLKAPEMTVLVGGLRTLETNVGQTVGMACSHGGRTP
jgi:catalase (peroxidase I)